MTTRRRDRAEQWTPEERKRIVDAERARVRDVTERQLNRRLVGWSAALVIMMIIIVVMTIRG